MSSLEKLLARGRDEGLKKGRDEGRDEGREQGLKKGRDEGRDEGREQGLWIGKIQMLQGIMQLEVTHKEELIKFPVDELKIHFSELESRYNVDFKQTKR